MIGILDLVRAQAPSVDILMELWSIARGQTPFVVLLLLAAIYVLNSERRLLQSKYDELFKQYVELAHDTRDTLKDIRDLFGTIAASRGRRWPDE
jgi:hypothetical protein